MVTVQFEKRRLGPCSLVLLSLRSHSYADDRVKEDLNASRALLALEHNIKKQWCVCGRPPSPSFGLKGPQVQGGCKMRTRHKLFLCMKRNAISVSAPREVC